MSFDEAAFQRKVTEHAARARADAGPPKAGDDRPVRWREFLEQSLFVRNVIREYIDRQLAERDQKIEALEKEIDDLRKSNADAMKYCGTFNRSQVYERGHVCTHSGVLWFAIKDTVGQQPGNSENWELMTKHNTVKAIRGQYSQRKPFDGKIMTEDEAVEQVLAWLLERAREVTIASFADSDLSDDQIAKHADEHYSDPAVLAEFRAKISRAIHAGADFTGFTSSLELH